MLCHTQNTQPEAEGRGLGQGPLPLGLELEVRTGPGRLAPEAAEAGAHSRREEEGESAGREQSGESSITRAQLTARRPSCVCQHHSQRRRSQVARSGPRLLVSFILFSWACCLLLGVRASCSYKCVCMRAILHIIWRIAREGGGTGETPRPIPLSLHSRAWKPLAACLPLGPCALAPNFK